MGTNVSSRSETAQASQIQPDQTAALHDLLTQRILILDGAMGTQIQAKGFSEADYRGERFADWPVTCAATTTC